MTIKEGSKTMKDIHYICESIASLSSLPIRIYKDFSLVSLHTIYPFCKDPFSSYEHELHKLGKSIRYFQTEDAHTYGIIVYQKYTIVIGPNLTLAPDKQNFDSLYFSLGITDEKEKKSLKASLLQLPRFPFTNFIQILCLVNFSLNNQKCTIEEIIVSNEQQTAFTHLIGTNIEKRNSMEDNPTHDTYEYEKKMLNYVKCGNVEKLKQLFKNTPPGGVGNIATTYERQYKNIFISSATLVVRAAIAGGLEQEIAFKLCDQYILTCELLHDVIAIQNLQYAMVIDYAKRVEYIAFGKDLSPDILQAITYIQKHIHTNLSVDEIAKEICMSRSYFSTKFKTETECSVAQYILRERINEAKKLLMFTDKPLSAISEYLCFSSQSHFQNTFKNLEGITPK